jgi:predicted transcriptional regulator
LTAQGKTLKIKTGNTVRLKEIAEILDAEIIVDSVNQDLDIKSACSADMMSAVLYYHAPNSVLITGLTQPQVIRTAEISGIKLIVFVFSKKPEQAIIDMARQKNIPILSTPFCMYSASGKLFQAGLPGCSGK